MGSKVQLRDNWESIKRLCMLHRQKFSVPDLKQKLIATEDNRLIEGNHWHDNYWGNCSCIMCESIEGQNWLGRILMHVRFECILTM